MTEPLTDKQAELAIKLGMEGLLDTLAQHYRDQAFTSTPGLIVALHMASAKQIISGPEGTKISKQIIKELRNRD